MKKESLLKTDKVFVASRHVLKKKIIFFTTTATIGAGAIAVPVVLSQISNGEEEQDIFAKLNINEIFIKKSAFNIVDDMGFVSATFAAPTNIPNVTFELDPTSVLPQDSEVASIINVKAIYDDGIEPPVEKIFSITISAPRTTGPFQTEGVNAKWIKDNAFTVTGYDIGFVSATFNAPTNKTGFTFSLDPNTPLPTDSETASIVKVIATYTDPRVRPKTFAINFEAPTVSPFDGIQTKLDAAVVYPDNGRGVRDITYTPPTGLGQYITITPKTTNVTSTRRATTLVYTVRFQKGTIVRSVDFNVDVPAPTSNSVWPTNLDQAFVEAMLVRTDKYGKMTAVFTPDTSMNNITFELEPGTPPLPVHSTTHTSTDVTIKAKYDSNGYQEELSFVVNIPAPTSDLETDWDDLTPAQLAVFTGAGLSKGATSIPSDSFKYKTIPDGTPIPAELNNIGSYAFKLATFEGGVIWPKNLWSNLDPANHTGQNWRGGDTAGKGIFDQATIKDISLFKLPKTMNVIPFGFMGSVKVISGTIDRNWIPNTVTAIGHTAFADFGVSTSFGLDVDIPSSVTTIGSLAFWSVQINIMTLPDNIELGFKTFGLNQPASASRIKAGFTIPQTARLGYASEFTGGVANWEEVFNGWSATNVGNSTGWSTGTPQPGAVKQ